VLLHLLLLLLLALAAAAAAALGGPHVCWDLEPEGGAVAPAGVRTNHAPKHTHLHAQKAAAVFHDANSVEEQGQGETACCAVHNSYTSSIHLSTTS
jgi:hypothetical protein